MSEIPLTDSEKGLYKVAYHINNSPFKGYKNAKKGW